MAIAEDLKSLTKSATKKWTKQRKAEEKGKNRSTRGYVYSDRVDFTTVAHSILPGAYLHSSGDGKYTVPKRNLFYASRQKFLERTGRELKYKYFANTLLVQYLNRHPETASWKITADPRGNLRIPNAKHVVKIPVGTIQIDNHLEQQKKVIDPLDLDLKVAVQWPSLAPGQRYQGVVYIEKEGFDPMIEEAGIAERRDLVFVSCKGHSVVAARKYVDEVCKKLGGVPLFVVHDFDKYGFEISDRLTTVSNAAKMNDRVTYQFKHAINVIDLGLRLEDAQAYGLEPEDCDFKGYFARDSICTDEEKAFLESGQRVELNAFTAPQFIEWLDGKLEHYLGEERWIPDDDVLKKAYRRALAIAPLNRAIKEATKDAVKKAKQATIPDSLRQDLYDALEDNGNEEPWDVALYRIVETKLYPDSEN